MLHTRLTEALGLRYPIVGAPMATRSGGKLAAAVTNAGGLGTFGGINSAGPDWVREQIRIVRSESDGPFGVGFITSHVPEYRANFEACLEEKVPYLIFSFGDPRPLMALAKAAGVKTMCQVQTLEGADLALEAGADFLIAQGNEAGGHSGYLNTLPCLALVLERAGDTPVLAAGGIASGRTLAAVLTAGAEGAMIGTALLATPEAVEVPDETRQLIVGSDGQDTVHTQVLDIISGAAWPAGIGLRMRPNRVVEEWDGRVDQLRERVDDVRSALEEAQGRSDPAVARVLYGQSAGFVKAIRPAADVVRSMCDDAEAILRTRPSSLLIS